jgi:N-acetylglucosaminyldiphosphoundecaprenol N-acetyl-beta-D-mannosaminyltransferase
MDTITVAELKINSGTKAEVLELIGTRVRNGQTTFITTPYSEFLYRALTDRGVMNLLNSSDIAVPDGIGIVWGAKFLSIPLTAQNYYGKIVQAFWQVIYSGAAILFRPSWVKKMFPEKIPGSDFIWDLTKLLAQEKKSIFLLGGFDDTPKLVAEKLSNFINGTENDGRQNVSHLKIAGWSNKSPEDVTLIEDIKKANPDAIFVAFGPIKQERWIADNKDNLSAKLYIGLGGTFDYIAGKRLNPPRFLRSIGLEWAYRLITQPRRFKRIYQATIGLIMALIRYKVFDSLPYRRNAVCCVLNKKGEVFVARYNSEKPANKVLAYPADMFKNWWMMPQGGVDENEDLVEGARREAWEETAMRNITLLGVSKDHFEYPWESQRRLFVGKRYQFKGQRQSIVYFLFTGEEKEIVLDWEELLEYKWVPWQQLDSVLNKKELAHIAQSDLRSGLVKLP